MADRKDSKGGVVNNPVQGEAGKRASSLSSFLYHEMESLEGFEQEWEVGLGVEWQSDDFHFGKITQATESRKALCLKRELSIWGYNN